MSVRANLSGLNENVPFLPDQRVISFLVERCSVPRPLAEIIAEYATHHFDDVIFGPRHWEKFWGATPVTLPSIRKLHHSVQICGREPPKPVKQMNSVECANFLGELGKREKPQLGKFLRTFLSRPVRAGEIPAGFTCAVTFIPQFVRHNGKVMAVTARTLASVLGPNPKEGGHIAKLDRADMRLDEILTAKDVDSTQPSCFFVMELDIAPGTKGKDPVEAIEQVRQQGDKDWNVPNTRNFIATVFARRAWKGIFYFSRSPWTFTYGQGKTQYEDWLVYGGFSHSGLYLDDHSRNRGTEDYGAAGSQTFPVSLISRL